MAKRKKTSRPIIARKAVPVERVPIRIPPPLRQRKSRKQQQLELSESYRITNQSPHGMKVIADLMLWCSAYNPIETNDMIAMAKAVERRNMATYIAQKLGLRDEHFPEEAWRTSAVADEMMGL